MLKQLDIFSVHGTENNPCSQVHLDENRDRFSKQCRKVFNLLMDGKELTVKQAMIDYEIHSLPRRLLDLKQNGVKFEDKWVNKVKTWSMSPEQIKQNKRFI